MDVHASPAEWPELREFLGAFQVRFRRPEGREALERYTTGLLTELPTKNGDTIAQAVPGTSAQRLQEFLTNMPWDEEDRNRQRVAKMIAEATMRDGVLVFDDTGFPKQGKGSVGVERQYAGTLGQVGHGQIAVTCCDSDRQATWPVAARLYLPKTWAYAPERRQQARVPAEITFQTKPEIALRLLDQARAWGCPSGVWWPTPTMGITRISWRVWKPGRNPMGWRCGRISRCGCGMRPPVAYGGRTSCWRRCRGGRGHHALAAGDHRLAAPEVYGRAVLVGDQ